MSEAEERRSQAWKELAGTLAVEPSSLWQCAKLAREEIERLRKVVAALEPIAASAGRIFMETAGTTCGQVWTETGGVAVVTEPHPDRPFNMRLRIIDGTKERASVEIANFRLDLFAGPAISLWLQLQERNAARLRTTQPPEPSR